MKWIADRLESFATDIHCREHLVDVEAAVSADGTVLGLRSRAITGVGPWSCYPRSSVVEGNQVIRLLTGPYRIRNYKAELNVVAQNKALMSQYRAVGHPIASMVMESMLDRAARDLQLDPVEIRRRNLVKRDHPTWHGAVGGRVDLALVVWVLPFTVEYQFAHRLFDDHANVHLVNLRLGF